jgi:MFS family permease
MSDLQTALQSAADEGIITKNQAEMLFPYLVERTVFEGQSAARGELSADRRGNTENPLEDSEAPRFVRGFHDILITIGILVLLAGLRGLFPVYVELPVILLLAEILIRRQRLALPAVVLSLALVHWIGVLVTTRLGLGDFAGLSPLATAFFAALPFPPLLALFYWRYRVPLSLATVLLSLLALLVIGVFYVIGVPFLVGGVRDPSNTDNGSLLLSLCILFGAALAMFAVAMYFDLKDPQRVTRRSDVAFWLHLATAPALLYTTIMLVFWLRLGGINSDPLLLNVGANAYSQAPLIVGIVLILMLVGVIIDRRAFVTSGLISLGVAIVSILRQSHAEFDTAGFAALLIVGLFVLIIGVGWPYLRRAIVGRLPSAMQARLPALR